MRFSVLAVSIVAAVVTAIGVSGCGKTVIDDVKTEGAIEHNLETAAGQKVRSVDCPSGVEVKAGTTFECTIELAGGETETATLKILNSEADVELTRLESEEGKAEPGIGSEAPTSPKPSKPGGGSSAEQRPPKGSK